VVESQEVCIALLFVGNESEEPNSTLVAVQGGFRVESNPALRGLHNGDVGTFVMLNFGNKSMSHVFLCDLLLKLLFLYFILRVS
jgi:hypothetical protein